MSRTTRHLPVPCPWCGRFNDSAWDPRGRARPKRGDASICFGCGEWQIFARGHMRKPTDDETVGLGLDATARRIRAAWMAMDAERRQKQVGQA